MISRIGNGLNEFSASMSMVTVMRSMERRYELQAASQRFLIIEELHG